MEYKAKDIRGNKLIISTADKHEFDNKLVEYIYNDTELKKQWLSIGGKEQDVLLIDEEMLSQINIEASISLF